MHVHRDALDNGLVNPLDTRSSNNTCMTNCACHSSVVHQAEHGSVGCKAYIQGDVLVTRLPRGCKCGGIKISGRGRKSVATAVCWYAELCISLLTWGTARRRYQTTVATLSRRARDVIEQAFEESVDGGRESPLLLSRLHDFGMRGCTGVEQTVLGGVAHLLNFEGSDTMSAGYYAQVSKL